MNLEKLIETCETRLAPLFQHYLQKSSCPASELQKAMSYAVLNGGKRIRPLLVYATGYALEATWDTLDSPACAIEFIHAFSLIHDDLPAMDNADLRRGKPSCHKAFNEPIAILAGDALQSIGFEILAAHPAPLTAEQRIQMVHILSHACGLYGMAGGQALDIAQTDQLLDMYQLKTGALLSASVKLGAVAANKTSPAILNILDTYAKNIGLAFQIQDDLLDAMNSIDTGKPHGLDLANNKATYPMIHGIAQTQQKIQDLFNEALEVIKSLGNRTNLLQELANMLLQRKK